MSLLPLTATLCAGLLVGAAPPTWDMSDYRDQPGLNAVTEGETLTVNWAGEPGQELRARFAVVGGTPTVRELAVRGRGGEWTVLGRDLVPEFGVTTGVRRTGHGLPEENRWDVFWDAPLNHPEEVRRVQGLLPRRPLRRSGRTGPGWRSRSPAWRWASSRAACGSRSIGAPTCCGLEAIAKTDEPSVAYIYQGGLKGFSSDVAPARRSGTTCGANRRRPRSPAARPGSRTSCGHGTGWRSPRARTARSPSSRRRTSSSSPASWR